ncbi:MAG: hypothetical protein CUN51_00675 [Candidatus Thermofonsia Clade 1 bacterium]|uniref:Uncharacterized protein n=1 Tax=Candidatus Thermofonsia Clade 1 bacterium TaxID=2364210 RepID=A0A2M8P3P9_9CHLR|nr:MAG: hypothetical protein CUN51_00675 [Candidatus Thermofonsia Clade 1 bacterium]
MRKALRRLGCALLFIPWLALMFAPCFVIALISQGEIVITWSDVPEDTFRIWLLRDVPIGGVGIATSQRYTPPQPDDGRQVVCTLIDVRFVVWQGNAQRAGALPSRQCACYERVPPNQAWRTLSVGDEACRLIGE